MGGTWRNTGKQPRVNLQTKYAKNPERHGVPNGNGNQKCAWAVPNDISPCEFELACNSSWRCLVVKEQIYLLYSGIILQIVYINASQYILPGMPCILGSVVVVERRKKKN